MYVFKVVVVYIFISILVSIGMLLNFKLSKNIYNSYIVNEPYYFWHIVTDVKIRELFTFTLSKRRFYMFFVFSLFLTLLFRLLTLPSCILFYIYYVLRIYFFSYFTTPELFIPRRCYETRVCSNYADLFIFLFYKQPRWIGFTYAYKTFTITKTSINYTLIKDRVKSLSSVLIFGISGWVLVFSIKLAEDLTLQSEKPIHILPELIIFNFKALFNKILNESKLLRIYKENGKIIFNPNNKIGTTFDTLRAFTNVSHIKTSVKLGKVLKHYGIPDFSSNNNSERNIDIQMTSTPIPNSAYLWLKTIHYREPYCAGMYNIVRVSTNVNRYPNLQILKSWGIDNPDKYSSLQEVFFLNRIIANDIPVIYEGSRFSDNLIVPKTNFTLEVLKNKNFYDYKTVKIFDTAWNDYNRCSNTEREDISLGITKLSVLDFHKYDTHYHTDLTDLIRLKVFNSTYNYGKELNIPWFTNIL